MSDTPSLRRQPQRKRGRERVTRILDAAADLFAEVGYEAATTNQIAARAETSIGSLYQFFGNKESILEALAARYNDDMHTQLDQRLNTVAADDLPAMLDTLVDTLHDFYVDNPGYHPVFYGSYHSESMATASQALFEAIIARFDVVLGNYAPHLTEAERRLKGGLVASVIKSQIAAMTELERAAWGSWCAELKRMIRAYVTRA